MRTLSTGEKSTLGSYKKIAETLFTKDSAAIEFMDEKIAAAPNGVNEEVIVDESQMIRMLFDMTIKKKFEENSKAIRAKVKKYEPRKKENIDAKAGKNKSNKTA